MRKMLGGRDPLWAAVATALAVASIDAGMAAAMGPTPLSDWNLLFAYWSLTALACIAVYAMLWIVLRTCASKRDGALAIALGFAMVLAFALCTLIGAFTGPQSRAEQVQAAALSFLASAGGVGVYYFLRSTQPHTRHHTLWEGGTLAVWTLALSTALAKSYWTGAMGQRLAVGVALVTLVATLALVMRSPHARRLCLALLGAVAAGGPWAALAINGTAQPSGAEPQKATQHVFLLIVDTLRADALSCYNTGAPQTPSIDALAEDGILFEKAFVTAPWTAPSLASILTALPPDVHGVDETSRLGATYTTLADCLQTAGFTTGAIGKNAFLEQCGLGKGFAATSFYPKAWLEGAVGARLAERLLPARMGANPNSSELTALAKRWVRRLGGNPSFLWLHYFDPHLPYDPPAAFHPPGSPAARIGYDFDGMQEIRRGLLVPTPREQQWIRSLYDAEVRYVDDELGEFLTALKEADIYDDALIVLTSDHGEEFWDHQGFEHGHTLYNELLQVPLVIKLPHHQPEVAGSRVQAPVSTLSIMPTVLELCDAETPTGLPRSLAQHWEGGRHALPGPPLFASGALYYEERQAVAFDGVKYIASAWSGTEEVYDLRTDPGEQHSLAIARPDLVERGRALLTTHRSACVALRQQLGGGDESIDMDPATERQLRSLGYMD